MQFIKIKQNTKSMIGDTFEVSIEGLSDLSDVTITELHFSCKKAKTDSTYVFHKTIGNGITLDGDGVYRCKASPSDTDVDAGKYYYDVVLVYGSDRATLVEGFVIFELGVTELE